MNAYDARRLQIGDLVAVYFSNARKVAVITGKVWPHFDVKATDHAGRVITRRARYQSLEAVTEADRKSWK